MFFFRFRAKQSRLESCIQLLPFFIDAAGYGNIFEHQFLWLQINIEHFSMVLGKSQLHGACLIANEGDNQTIETRWYGFDFKRSVLY